MFNVKNIHVQIIQFVIKIKHKFIIIKLIGLLKHLLYLSKIYFHFTLPL